MIALYFSVSCQFLCIRVQLIEELLYVLPQTAFNHFNLSPSGRFLWVLFLFVLRPTTGQVQHKAFIKVGPDAGPQTTCVRQMPKIPSAPLAFLH